MTQTWSFTDDCGNSIQYIQTITVLPAPQAQFAATEPVTIPCGEAISYAPGYLTYTNAGSGGCLISGQEMGVITGTYDECGGTLIQTWTFTDDCARPIQHVQNITVNPAPVPDWVNPPADDQISCADAITYAAAPVSRAYTNKRRNRSLPHRRVGNRRD